MTFSATSRPPWFPLPPAWRAYAIATPNTVLLETGGGQGADHLSYLFHSPARLLEAHSSSDFSEFFAALEAAKSAGLYAAGNMHYEAAYALHGLRHSTPGQTVACFGIYAQPLTFDHHTGRMSGPPIHWHSNPALPVASALITVPEIRIELLEYASKIAEIQRLLSAGDTYQVNFTTRVTADLLASPLALYQALIDAQPVDFAAIVHFGRSLTLSFSPELFFRIDNGRCISTRPMKGTAPRGDTPEADAAQSTWLRHDQKNRAEHVMIVDLLRNDLGRICETGSVRTDNLFQIESHPTLFQMTSCIGGRLLPTTDFGSVIRALFPSGSITGAPKRRTMEIIRDLEPHARGVYTGAIGFLSPTGMACFSVPIRTLNVRGTSISMGVGGGVVADSTAEAEYAECRLKAAFLDAAAQPIRLIETLLWNGGYPLLELHLERLSASANELGFRYDPAQVRASLASVAERMEGATRVRLLLSGDGKCTTQTTALAGRPDNLRVRVSHRRLHAADPWLRHKTTHRRFYDRELARAQADGYDEVLFLNERDELAEGAISNLFVVSGDQLYTPPLTAGVLPGVLRRKLLAAGAMERTLHIEDLRSANAAYLGNALRGLRSVGRFEFE